ncbi:MAG: riboflavin kinase, partial [Betaproteobacteria bacterium]
QLPTVVEDGERVSSSAVRAALATGDLQRAARLLGQPYFISGRVQHGRKLGRALGFPTLNLRFAHKRPALHGVFAVRVHGIGAAPLPGVASVGLRPTVEESGRWLLEVHLFDFARDVYGHLVRVEFLHKLRDEEKYDTLDQLTVAIRGDSERARALIDAPAAK